MWLGSNPMNMSILKGGLRKHQPKRSIKSWSYWYSTFILICCLYGKHASSTLCHSFGGEMSWQIPGAPMKCESRNLNYGQDFTTYIFVDVSDIWFKSWDGYPMVIHGYMFNIPDFFWGVEDPAKPGLGVTSHQVWQVLYSCLTKELCIISYCWWFRKSG